MPSRSVDLKLRNDASDEPLEAEAELEPAVGEVEVELTEGVAAALGALVEDIEEVTVEDEDAGE